MNKKEKTKGITLVSLVVTIVILIILAGVSINLTLGENGIITMAKKARENMELAQIDEDRQLNELYEQIVTEGGASGNASDDAIIRLVEFKREIASAITDMGIETAENADATTMSSNIRSLTGASSADKVSYDNINSGLTSTNVQGAVDELSDSLSKNLRYNSQNDKIEIFYNGSWKEYKTVGLQNYRIFKSDDTNNISYGEIFYERNKNYLDVNITNISNYQRFATVGSTDSDNVYIPINTDIDLSQYSKLICTYEYASIPTYESVLSVSSSDKTFSPIVRMNIPKLTTLSKIELDISTVNSGFIILDLHGCDLYIYDLELVK